MTVAAARWLAGRAACFVGIGLPSTAANLARRPHAPDLALVYETGRWAPSPRARRCPSETESWTRPPTLWVSVPEVSTTGCSPGRVDVGFLGAAQMGGYGNIDSTVIGDYRRPKVRLPGAGGAPEIAASCRWVFVVVRASAPHVRGAGQPRHLGRVRHAPATGNGSVFAGRVRWSNHRPRHAGGRFGDLRAHPRAVSPRHSTRPGRDRLEARGRRRPWA